MKLTFAKGASLPRPQATLQLRASAAVRGAIDFAADAKVDETAFKALIQAAAAFNKEGGAGASK